jgi:4-amino-4-deoxy-L-arabinose transferase-like glycosyltransferase
MTTSVPEQRRPREVGKSADREHQARAAGRLLAAVVVLFIGLGVLYSGVVPIFEKPDEYMHYFYIQHLLDEHSLPIVEQGGKELWEQEGSQPPLYYALAALVVSPIDTSDARRLLWLNPQRNLGNPGDPGNKNVVVHPAGERSPLQGATLAVHVARWLSLVLGAGTVVVTYQIARRILPQRPLLAAGTAAIAAFIPQVLFISSSVSNDSLITFLTALVLWQLVTLVGRPAGRELVPYVGLGCTLGLVALAKLGGLVLIPFSGLILAWLAWRRRSWWPLIPGSLIVGGLVLVVAGWWYLRNLQLYGDLTGLSAMASAMGGREPFQLTWIAIRDEFFGLRASFWGLFGWFSILMPQWIYTILDVATVLALVGLVRWFGRSPSAARQVVAWMLVWVGIMEISLARWTLMTNASQGRLLFPALPAITLALSIGWSELLPWRWSAAGEAIPLGMAAGLLVLAGLVPGSILAPVYQSPPRLREDQIPQDVSRLEVTFGGSILLHGCRVDEPAPSPVIGVPVVAPGDVLAVTCYWQALAPINEDLFTYHHLLGRSLEPVGKEQGYPASGKWPTSLWIPGQVVAATEWLRVGEEIADPALGRLAVGIYHQETGETLAALTPQGGPAGLVVAAEVKIAGSASGLSIPNPLSYTVGDQVELVGYRVEREPELAVTLYWAPTKNGQEDLTVFVHLLGKDGELWGQGDSPPANGDYPTSLWAVGETIVDRHQVTVREDHPAGEYQLVVGLYRPGDDTRLHVRDAHGVEQPGGRIFLPDSIVYR